MAKISILQTIGTDEGELSSFDFDKMLSQVEPSEPLEVLINSKGGDVNEGFAIARMLRAHPGQVTTVAVTALSISSVIFCAGDKRIVAPDEGTLMIHKPWTDPGGSNATQLRQSADLCDKLTKGFVGAYTRVTNLKPAELDSMMENETWLNADEALKLGFANEPGEVVKGVKACFDPTKYRNAPKRFFAGVDTGTPGGKHEVIKMPITMQQIKGACVGAKPEFLVAQMSAVENGASLEQVSAAWSAETNENVKAMEEENQTLQAKGKAMEEENKELTELVGELETLALAMDPEYSRDDLKEMTARAKAMDDDDVDGLDDDELDELDAEEDEKVSARATKRRNRRAKPVKGVSSAGQRRGKSNARQTWNAKVDAKVSGGMTKNNAVMTVNRENPGLRQRMVAEANR